jgi:predicted secreted Zn-dependent protease
MTARDLIRIAAAALTMFAPTVLAPAQARAKITISESTSYYPVKGRTGIELGRAMLAGGQRSIRLNHAIAATATRFSFVDPVVKIEGNRCVLKDVRVVLEIAYKYPKWDGREAAPAGVRATWDTFYAELVRHEKTHGGIARNFAKRIEAQMRGMYGNVSVGCRDFGDNAKARFSQLAGKLKAEQAAFDAREQVASSKISQLQLRLIKAK